MDALLRARPGINVIGEGPRAIEAVPEAPQAMQHHPDKTQGLRPTGRLARQCAMLLQSRRSEAQVFARVDKDREIPAQDADAHARPKHPDDEGGIPRDAPSRIERKAALLDEAAAEERGATEGLQVANPGVIKARRQDLAAA